MKKFFSKDTLAEFFKFGIVGIINTLLSYGLSNLFYYIFKLHEQIVNIIVFVITVGISYLLNKKFVFKSSENSKKSIVKVYISYGITLILSAVLIHVEVRVLSVPYYLALIMNLCVTVPINYLLNKFFVFGNKKKE